MIKAVIFDCYGVLAQDSWLPFKRKHFLHDEVLWEAATRLNKQLDTGQISFEEFTLGAAKLAGTDPVKTHNIINTSPPNNELFIYIEQNLKQNYGIGLLSNAGENILNELFTPQQNSLFDEAVLSCEIGYAKPSPEAYAAIINKLNVAPHEAVFIDDQPRYVIGASEFGLNSVQYKSNQQIAAELEHLLAEKEA